MLADVIADAEPATAIVGRRGEVGGGACVIVVSEFGDDGTQGSVLGEKLSFAGFEFADSVVGLVELSRSACRKSELLETRDFLLTACGRSVLTVCDLIAVRAG